MVMVGMAGCNEEVHRVPLGEPCSEEEKTLCDSLCLLELPNGMCSHDCSEDESICPEGFVCGDISGGRYCLMACDDDDDCREGTICVIGQCRLAMGLGAACEEDGDCVSEICYDGACDVAVGFGWKCDVDDDCHSGLCYDDECNLECHRPGDCPEETSCIDPGDGVPVCLEYDPPEGGEGRYGENCTFSDCDEDFLCLSRTEDPADDPYAFCTESCRSELECPPDMTCRRTQRAGRRESVLRCVPRAYCERCAYDGQCGVADDKCVSLDPMRGVGRYCSQTCDIESPITTCPTDSTCREAYWCAPDRSWVADCEWCSDEDDCGSDEDGPQYQCFKDYGACAGSGEDYCAPCFVDRDCPDDGFCAYDFYQRNAYCTEPCPDGEDGGCPYEHGCWSYPEEDEEWQCVPRSGSCSVPSGGVTTCYPCDGYGDCISGYCLNEDLEDPRTQMVCWEDCSEADCPPYTICYTLTNNSGENVYLCGPPDGWTCVQSQLCREECPEGPDSCSADARSYCLSSPT